MSPQEREELAQMLKPIQQELKSLRAIVRDHLPIIEKMGRAEWVDMEEAMSKTGLKYRRLYNRVKGDDELRRKRAGVGLQINMTAYKEKYQH